MLQVDASAILQLPVVGFAASSVHSCCMQGTRLAVLERVWRWAEKNTPPKSIFWLCDIAGSGKSTVAMSAAERWRAEGTFGGQFFFSMTTSEGSTTEKLCSTIARELAHHPRARAAHRRSREAESCHHSKPISRAVPNSRHRPTPSSARARNSRL